MPCLSHLPLFNHRSLKIMKQYFTFSCHFLSVRSKFSSHHTVFNQPYSERTYFTHM
jgi:hypothetical protein